MTDETDNVSSLTVKRFHQNIDPAKHDPVAAIEAALEWVRSMEEKPTHIVVVVGRDTEKGGSATRYFQAGTYRHHAQQGLLAEAALMMRDS